jgi:hypothetical protein
MLWAHRPPAVFADGSDEAAEAAARAHLIAQQPATRGAAVVELRHAWTHRSPTGYHVRFDQFVDGVRVVEGSITAHLDSRLVGRLVTGEHVSERPVARRAASTDAGAAQATAIAAIAPLVELRGSPSTELVYSRRGGGLVLEWLVLVPTLRPLGDYQLLIDAQTGSVVESVNLIPPHKGGGVDPRPRPEPRTVPALVGTKREPNPPMESAATKSTTAAATSGQLAFTRDHVTVAAPPVVRDQLRAPTRVAETLRNERFESDFPGPWRTIDNNGGTGGDRHWDDTDFHRFSGQRSGWPAAGGENGLDPAIYFYPNFMDSWMVYGPFSLEDANAATMNFRFWLRSEANYDFLYYLASVDGNVFSGFRVSGYTAPTHPPTSEGWEYAVVDFAGVPNLGNVLGRSQVWIAFRFTSDGSQVDDGPFIDDVVITRATDAGCASGPASGRAMVFRSNPIAQTGNGALGDSGDSDLNELNEQRSQMTILGLDGTGKLRGAFANATAAGISGAYLPAGIACSTSGAHEYTRADDRFEEAMVYHHVDSARRYFAGLGFPSLMNRSIPIHAHYYPVSNAFYSRTNGGLHFGDEGADLAEDGEVVVHEYAHAVLDSIKPGITSHEGRSLHEGLADYLAASVLAAHNVDAQKPCFAEWAATNIRFQCIRSVASNLIYPDNLTNVSVHADGIIWSSTLWQLRGLLGGEVTDRMVLQSLYYLPSQPTQDHAANSLLLADDALYGGRYADAVLSVLRDRGYLRQVRVLRLSTTEGGSVRVDGPTIGPTTCDAYCTLIYLTGTEVEIELNGSPLGQLFSGWSGGCAGRGVCRVVLANDTQVQATYRHVAPADRAADVGSPSTHPTPRGAIGGGPSGPPSPR